MPGSSLEAAAAIQHKVHFCTYDEGGRAIGEREREREEREKEREERERRESPSGTPHAQQKNITLHFGLRAERPFVDLGLGAAFLAEARMKGQVLCQKRAAADGTCVAVLVMDNKCLQLH